MNIVHNWEYRKVVTDIPPDSVLHALNHIDDFPSFNVLKNIFERRANLQLATGDLSISSIHPESPLNREWYAPATDYIVAHVKEKKPILIWGDYDVDGMTSTAAMVFCLKSCGVEVSYSVPNRLDQGYGIDVDLIHSLVPPGSLVITVDNGISDVEPVKRLKSLGYKVIITDHHLVEGDLPDADFIVNPKVLSTNDNPEYMAPGVYVASKLVLDVVNKLTSSKSLTKEQLTFCHEMVALGIVSDVIELNPLFYQLLQMGLVALNTTRHRGLIALFEMCGMRNNQTLSTAFLGYSVIPKLNAAGRMGQPLLGIELLLMEQDSSPNYTTTLLAANNLKYLNADRKIIEANIFQEAISMAFEYLKNQCLSLVIFQKDWHPGVLGIIAARIAELTHRPTIIITNEGDMIKGSGRSVPGFDLYGALKQCSDTLIGSGGHSAAAGVKLAKNQIDDFRAQFEKVVKDTGIPTEQTMYIDADVTISNLFDVQFPMYLFALEPMGNMNPDVVLKLSNVTVISSEIQRDALNLLVKEDSDKNVVMLTKFRPPAEYTTLLHKKIDVLISPSVTYFSGSTTVEWKIQSIKIVEEN